MYDRDEATAAYHEAGHVLMAALLGGRVVLATLEDEDETRRARTTVSWPPATTKEHRRRSALVALAGPLAEARFRGDVDPVDEPTEWRGDHAEVAAALAFEPGERRDAELREWLLEVRAALFSPEAWEQLCRIADALEAHGTLDEDLLDDMLA